VAFIVNSSPGAGLRFEPSATVSTVHAARDCVERLSARGMRLIRVRDTETGSVFDEKGLRAEIARLKSAS
jgi:hypothetical protein